jgi:hypothetical protein
MNHYVLNNMANKQYLNKIRYPSITLEPLFYRDIQSILVLCVFCYKHGPSDLLPLFLHMFYPENQGSFNIWPGDNVGPFCRQCNGIWCHLLLVCFMAFLGQMMRERRLCENQNTLRSFCTIICHLLLRSWLMCVCKGNLTNLRRIST